MVTGKILEAIGLEAPVLVIAPYGSDAKCRCQDDRVRSSLSCQRCGRRCVVLSDLMDGKTLEPTDTAAYAWGIW
jgi:hypothetical protein